MKIELDRPIKLKTSRAWRTYLGGKMIDRLHGTDGEDNNFPEEWLMSTVCARNAGREDIVEGISTVDGTDVTLKNLIDEHPDEMLGHEYAETTKGSIGVLVKLLDSAERLTVQVHPTKEKAKTLFQSEYGKTECWHILGVREIAGIRPSIYLGFKQGITREEWVDCFLKQDIKKMLSYLNEIPVRIGDTYIVHGGVPHAIGCGCFLVEIQEPTDYTIRTERITPSGRKVADFMCHQGLGFQKMFDCFSYDGYTQEEAIEKWKVTPIRNEYDGFAVSNIIYPQITTMFALNMIEIQKECILEQGRFSCIYVLDGEGKIDGRELKKCDHYFIPYTAKKVVIQNTGNRNLKLIRCFGKEIEKGE